MNSPRLLVSVRDLQETQAAVAGGADIVDVKEPANGSLGRASLRVISDVVQFCDQQVQSSAALGELLEWRNEKSADCDSIHIPLADEFPDLPTNLSFAKVGLAGLKDCVDWQSQYVNFLASRFPSKSTDWIAVAYADAELADAPAVIDVLDLVVQTPTIFAGMLIDTYDKSSGHLLECLDSSELLSIRRRLSETGQLLALAGKLNESLLLDLRTCDPDIIAIRGAACEGSDRTLAVAESRVATFRSVLSQTFSIDDCAQF